MSSDGGSAFPHVGCNTNGGINVVEPGMSLRDWFAGQALVGILSRDNYYASVASEESYSMADAMLRQRNTHCSDCGRKLSETGGGTCQTCEVK